MRKKVFSIVENSKPVEELKRYFIVVNQKQFGPYPLEEIQKMRIPANTKVWTEGMEDWLEARFVFDKEVLITAMPPPIPGESDPNSLKSRKIVYKPTFRESLRHEIIQNLKIALIGIVVSCLMGLAFYTLKKGFNLKSLSKKYNEIQIQYANKKIDSLARIKALDKLDASSRKLGYGTLIIKGSDNYDQEIDEKLSQLKTQSIQIGVMGFIGTTLFLVLLRYVLHFFRDLMSKKDEF